MSNKENEEGESGLSVFTGGASIAIAYSPIILATVLTSFSFVFQNASGFVYLLFLIAASLLHHVAMPGATLSVEGVEDNCFKDLQMDAGYKKTDKKGFSIFVWAFSFFYVCYPMFFNNDINYFIFSALLTGLVINIATRKKCMTGAMIGANIIGGSFLGIIIPVLIYASGSGGQYLFYNDISSSSTSCSLNKSKQTFKCKVYKNGELVGSNNSS